MITKQQELAALLKDIPNTSGVYFFWGKDCLLYIGKSINIKKRIQSHLSTANACTKEAKLVSQTTHFTWLITAGELGALLKESLLIKQLHPLLNRRLRRNKQFFTFQLNNKQPFLSVNVVLLPMDNLDIFSESYGLFKNRFQALEKLRGIIRDHQLCENILHGFNSNRPCFAYQIKRCLGACVGKESFEEFNERFMSILKTMQLSTWPYEGSIAIKEENPKHELTEYHVINRWCYFDTLLEINDIDSSTFRAIKPFDRDSYMILLPYLFTPENEKNIILLK